jgi:hemolysin activation/secretion protein
MRIRARIVTLMAFCLVALPARAAAPPLPENELRALERQRQQIILQQEERRRQQEETLRQRGSAPPEGAVVPAIPHVEEDTGRCIEVAHIVVHNVTLFSESTLDDITASYENRCLTLGDINNLLRDVTNLYISGGYVTSRAFVNPEGSDAAKGTLELYVLEGRIGKIIVNDDMYGYGQKLAAFPGLEGKPLNLRDIEQGLDQLNRLPSNDATMEIAPGDAPGSSDIIINTQSEKSWRASGGVDNLGQRAISHYQYTLSFEKDNPVGLGDQLAVFWTSNADFLNKNTRNEHPPGGGTDNLSAYFSLPFGYWTLSAGGSLSKYANILRTEYYEFSSRGATGLLQVGLDRVVRRDAESKTSMGARFTYRNVDHYIEDAKLAVSSYSMSSLTFSGMHSRRAWGGSLGLGLDYAQGLSAFSTPNKKGEDMPEAGFRKFGLSLNWYKPIELGGERCSWRMNAQGQYSPDTLYGAERMQIGGFYTVRGFSDDSLMGDSGAFVRNELAWSLGKHLPEQAAASKIVADLELFAAYDCGFIVKDKSDPYERGEVKGIAVGLRTQGNFSSELVLAQALSNPSFLPSRQYEIYCKLAYVF